MFAGKGGESLGGTSMPAKGLAYQACFSSEVAWPPLSVDIVYELTSTCTLAISPTPLGFVKSSTLMEPIPGKFKVCSPRWVMKPWAAPVPWTSPKENTHKMIASKTAHNNNDKNEPSNQYNINQALQHIVRGVRDEYGVEHNADMRPHEGAGIPHPEGR